MSEDPAQYGNKKTIKSDFQFILSEDCKQYDDIFERYMNIVPENGDEAFDLAKTSLVLAQRWSEIQASTGKIVAMANETSVQKTDFKAWAYQRYRNLQLIHEHCRIIWRQVNEQYLYFERQGQA